MADRDSRLVEDELTRLRQQAVVLPRHTGRAAASYADAVKTNHELLSAAGHDLNRLGVQMGRTITSANYDSPEVQRMLKENDAKMAAMGSKRALNYRSQRQAAVGQRLSTLNPSSPMGGDAYNAIPRFYDPLEYWDLSGLPWNVADEGHRHKLHKWLRLYYATHYLVPVLIDIFTRFPLVGMELECKDPALVDIYEDIFFDTLDYPEFLVALGREYWCALPGELIQGSAGPVAIEEVQAGDLVLTHKGVLKPVKGASSREYSGKYVKLRPHYGLPMRYTYGHPFLINRDGKTQWVSVEEIQITDELFVPVDQRVEDRTQVNVWETLQGWLQVPSMNELGAWPIPDHITWTDSEAKYRGWVHRQTKNLTPGDVWKRLGPYAQHSPLKADIDLTDDLLWFFGLYLAEGAVTKDGIRISLHAKEMAYAERVVALAADFGLNANVIRGSSENGINVNVYSIAFGAWIKSLLGTGHSGKRIAEWMMILPAERQAHLLRGYFDGDGHYGDVRVHAASASLSLALQVERMIRRQGIVTTINECNSTTVEGYDCRRWVVGPAIGDTRVFLERLGVLGKREFQKRQFGRWQGANEGYWVKVFQIDRTGEYSGPVYNIEVEDDHSYVGSVATHNCVGEAFPLASFDEDLGVWEHEELINPEDVVINNFPFLNTQQLKIVPPDYLRRIAQTKAPAREWYLLQEQFADLIPYLLKGEHIPISPVMFRQVANKLNNWDDHGTPILLRGLRTLLHEEKLLASQDAIAERLYSPLILAKLGIMDMGDGQPPWLPGPNELESVRDDLDIALSSDFRVMVHHFGLDITSVFGREQMPRLGDDFDRIERRLMQVFGVNPSLLSAGSNSQPYASSALQAEFMNQILRTFQNMLKNHYKERALVVAEAQEHQDYEKKGPQPFDARVLTPSGWTTMGDISVGDRVIGGDGKPTRVIEVIDQGMQDTYRLTFSDGSVTECALNHNWSVLSHSSKTGLYRVHTLEELLQKGITYRDESIRKFRVPHVAPVEFDSLQEDLPVDPYLLGMLLGDGTLGGGNGSIRLATHFDDLIETADLIEDLLPARVFAQPKYVGSSPYLQLTRDPDIYRNPLSTKFKQIGLWKRTWKDKFIPELYLRSNIESRIALLQGLMDSDGCTHKTPSGGRWTVFCTDNDILAEGVIDLVGSLGGSATLWDKRRSDEKEVYIKRLPEGIVPHRLSRKVANYHMDRPERSGRYRHLDSVQKLGQKPMRCITVDNDDHLYVTDDYIVTHNSTRVPIFERIVVYDEEGNKQIKEVPKLLIPDLSFSTFDLRDEATERQFLMNLRQMGVPIPNEDLLIGVNWKYKDKLTEYNRELKEQTIEQQRAKMDTYYALTVMGLPVPLDLKAECESVLVHGPGAGGGAPQGAMPGGKPTMGPPGGGPGAPGQAGAGPEGQSIVMPPPPPGLGPGPGTAPPGGGAPPMAPMQAGPPGTVPPVSNERRPGLKYNTSLRKNADDEDEAFGIISFRKDSAVDQFFATHEDLGLPFADYLIDQLDSVADASAEDIASLYETWPEHESAYRLAVASEADWRFRTSKEAAIVEKPAEEKGFKLKDNQTLVPKTASSEERIVEDPKRRRVRIESEKRYAIIDPFAPELPDDDDQSTEPESTR